MPQLFVASGATTFGRDYRQYPWTIGYMPPYSEEGRLYGNYILAHVKHRLGIDVGETTEDGRITLQAVECLCACEAAPMMQVDDRYELNLTPEKCDRVLEGLR